MGIRFIDNNGTFELENAGANSYLYFPLCNEAGIMSSITPMLGGDSKLDQDHFILQPESVEDLHNNRSTRNFWLRFGDGRLRSAAGVSVWQRAGEDAAAACSGTGERTSGTLLRAGLLWHEITNEIFCGKERIRSKITSFVPVDASTVEVMRVELENTGDTVSEFDPIAVIPLYGRSASNIRDHRHVTSLLHRISAEKYGVYVKPTLSFDERGHLRNDTEYFTIGCDGEGSAPEGFYPTVAAVIGEGGDFERPLGLKENNSGVEAGYIDEGVEAVGGLKFSHRILRPGESAEFIVFIGARKEDDVENSRSGIISRLGNAAAIEKSLEENKRFWIGKARAGLGNSSDESGHGSICKTENGKTVEIGDKCLGKTENYMLWVAVEPVLRRIFGCSFLPYHDYGKGGRGWRDLWQDCLALMLGNPSSVRELLINNFAGVRADGTNATIIGKNPGEFIADRNGIARVWMDHGVWPWITVQLYMELSRDTGILEVRQSYFKDKLCCRARAVDEGYLSEAAVDEPADGCTAINEDAGGTAAPNLLLDDKGKVYRGSILEHILLMHVTAACDVGEHGHMLLRGADWNDALDMAAQRGESVAFTAAYAGNMIEISKMLSGKTQKFPILKELYEMIEKLATVAEKDMSYDKDTVLCAASISEVISSKRRILDEYCEAVRRNVSGETVEIAGDELSKMLDLIGNSIIKLIRKTEYMQDGELGWYNGYYDNEGMRVESIGERRLMLTSAVFTIMSGVATDDQIRSMIRTADELLCTEETGGYRLNTRFENEEQYAHKLGRMFGFAYGSKENGAVFCHMAVMYAYALQKRGFRKEAEKVVHMLIKQSERFESSRMYPGIPEYFDKNGRGMYPYLTGAASWMLLLMYRLGRQK